MSFLRNRGLCIYTESLCAPFKRKYSGYHLHGGQNNCGYENSRSQAHTRPDGHFSLLEEKPPSQWEKALESLSSDRECRFLTFSTVWFPLLREVVSKMYGTNANQRPTSLGRADPSCLLSLLASASPSAFMWVLASAALARIDWTWRDQRRVEEFCLLGWS